jgi:hypothetical protein
MWMRQNELLSSRLYTKLSSHLDKSQAAFNKLTNSSAGTVPSPNVPCSRRGAVP